MTQCSLWENCPNSQFNVLLLKKLGSFIKILFVYYIDIYSLHVFLLRGVFTLTILYHVKIMLMKSALSLDLSIFLSKFLQYEQLNN